MFRTNSSLRSRMLQVGAAACLAVSVAALAAPRQARAAALVLQGSTTFNTAIMVEHQAEVERLSGETLTVLANKSNLGLQALLDHRADLAMISTVLQNEVGMLKQGAAGSPVALLQVHSITRSQAILIVHPSNPVRSLTFDQLRGVLTGQLTNWRELGGPDLAIRIIAARQGGGVVTTVESRVLGSGNHIDAPSQVRVQTGPQIVMIVEQEPGSLGITMGQLAQGHAVVDVTIPEAIALELNLVSLGEPTAAMLRVIEGCREVASQNGL